MEELIIGLRKVTGYQISMLIVEMSSEFKQSVDSLSSSSKL